MLLSQVKIVFIDNYKTLVENWITVDSIVNDINCFVLRDLEILTLAGNRFRHLHFNCFKVKTTFYRWKEKKRRPKDDCYETC